MGDGNGFTIAGYSSHELYEACCHAQDAYNNKENWHNLVHHCMECDFSWDAVSYTHLDVYKRQDSVWELFIPGVKEFDVYKYCVTTRAGDLVYKACLLYTSQCGCHRA